LTTKKRGSAFRLTRAIILGEVRDEYGGVAVLEVDNVEAVVVLIGDLRLVDEVVVEHIPDCDLTYINGS
jgi:hypothetical protein